MYRKFVKRTFDMIVSAAGLIVTAPLLIVIAAVLAFVNGGSPFFFQQRPGRGGKLFRIIKFKTMNDKRGESGQLLPNSLRTHAPGRFIRSLSLDELPQMINVLCGDMSFVGPRPLLPEYLPLYSDLQARRHEVRPGITGWAQVNGRNTISWEQKFEFDVWYVDNLSLALDFRIVVKSIRKVFAREGVNSDKNTTMTPFRAQL